MISEVVQVGGYIMDFEKIYQLYFKDIYFFLKGLSSSEAIAEEITQETFFKALKHLNQYDASQDIRAWLYTIARNTYYSYYKKAKRCNLVEDTKDIEDNKSDVLELLIDENSAFTIYQCLHHLDEPYKEVFSLRILGELPFEKIGAIFGKNSSWARVTFYRAKIKIVEALEELEHEN